MSWNYKELDQRHEIALLKEQLSVQAARCAQYEDKVFKYEHDLEETKGMLQETTNKLRHEESQVVRLETDLKRRTEDYNREKFDRENKENSLRNMEEELKRQATAHKESHLVIERLSRDNNGSLAEHTKAIQDKVKLENQVRELQGELRLKSQSPPPISKASRRPRSSSLTNFKVASLESDLAQATSSSSQSKAELERTTEKLSRAQHDLVRVENEKCALEKRVVEKDRLLREKADEIAMRDEELSFLRQGAGNADREAELIARIEEEEVRCRLLEQQLAQTSRGAVPRRTFEDLQERIVDLTTEKEIAQSELHDVSLRLRQCDEDIKAANLRLKEAEKDCWALRDQVYSLQCKPAQIDDETVNQLNATVTRLRTERDNALRSLEFMQMESRFTIDALHSKVVSSETVVKSSSPVPLIVDNKRVALITCGLVVAMQHIQSRNDSLLAQLDNLRTVSDNQTQEIQDLVGVREELERSALSSSDSSKVLQFNLNETSLSLASVRAECDGLHDLISDLRGNIESLTGDLTQLQGEVGKKEEEILDLRSCLSTNREELERVLAERELHEQQIRTLEENLASVQRDLQDAEERANRLQAAQFSLASSDDKTRALKEEIKVLESRVLRRTEQIGIHQHDIKRLETNMRLAEERLGEMSSELEMANTEKEAMLEDCAMAREERDEAKRVATNLETTVDDLTTQVSDKALEVSNLQKAIADLHATTQEIDGARVAELATLVSVIIDRQSRLKQLSGSLSLRNAELRDTKGRLEESKRQIYAMSTSHDDATARLNSDLQARELEVVSLLDRVQKNEEALRSLTQECERLRQTRDSMESIAVVADATSERVRELEAECSNLQQQNAHLRTEIDDRNASIASLEETIIADGRNHENVIAKVEEESAKLKEQLKVEADEHDSMVSDLKQECEQRKGLLESARREIADLRTSYENELASQHELATKDAAELQDRVNELLSELDEMRNTTEAERHAIIADKRKLEDELATLCQQRDIFVESEASLRKQLRACEAELDDVKANLGETLAEKAKLRIELDDLTGETQRAISRSDSMQKQALQSERTVATLQNEIGQLRDQLAQSEKAGKTAEMNLLLTDTEHKKTISTLRQQLLALEKGGAQLTDLQSTNNELQEQVTEMESLLRGKCAEIEENDDKFIELLKEKKKLSNKVESLTKKVANLQSKLERASRTPSPPSVAPLPKSQPAVVNEGPQPPQSRLQSQPRQPLASLPADSLSISQARTRSSQFSSSKTLPPPPPQPERVFSQIHPSHERVFKENRPQPSSISAMTVPPINMAATISAPPPSAGKKRRAPDDDDVPSLPPTALVADPETPPGASSFFEPMSNSQAGTPRFKRHIQALKTGFTPSRLQGLRPTLSQPSPIRKTTSSAAPTMHDVTNSPRRVISMQPKPRAGSSWLNKIHNKTGNALNLGRTSRQASTDDLFDSDNLS